MLGLPPQCSSLYEERYILPSQTLNSQGSSPVQETHPLLGEWKVSTLNPPLTHTGPPRPPSPSLSGSTFQLIKSIDPNHRGAGWGWGGVICHWKVVSASSQEALKQPLRVL